MLSKLINSLYYLKCFSVPVKNIDKQGTYRTTANENVVDISVQMINFVFYFKELGR